MIIIKRKRKHEKFVKSKKEEHYSNDLTGTICICIKLGKNKQIKSDMSEWQQ